MTRVKLLGVVEDGTVPRVGLPLDARTPLRLHHRVPTRIELEVVTVSSVPYQLETGDAFAFVIKERAACDTLPLLQVSGAADPTRGANVAAFSLTAAHTENLEPRHYQYDIWMVRAGVGMVLVPTSLLILERTVYAP